MIDNIDIVVLDDHPHSGIPPTPSLLGVSLNSGKKVCAGRRCGQKRERERKEGARGVKGEEKGGVEVTRLVDRRAGKGLLANTS
jgi:hypothetical protein